MSKDQVLSSLTSGLEYIYFKLLFLCVLHPKLTSASSYFIMSRNTRDCYYSSGQGHHDNQSASLPPLREVVGGKCCLRVICRRFFSNSLEDALRQPVRPSPGDRYTDSVSYILSMWLYSFLPNSPTACVQRKWILSPPARTAD